MKEKCNTLRKIYRINEENEELSLTISHILSKKKEEYLERKLSSRSGTQSDANDFYIRDQVN